MELTQMCCEGARAVVQLSDLLRFCPNPVQKRMPANHRYTATVSDGAAIALAASFTRR